MAEGERLLTIEADGRRIIEVARSDPDRTVPQYPTWTLRDLALHVANVHHRTAEICQTLPQERIPFRELPQGKDAFDQAQTVLEHLLDALSEADPDASVWSFGTDRHVRFWERRMVIETGVHRWDAESSVGTPDPLPERVTVDGLDEFPDFYLARLGEVPTNDVLASDLDRTWRYGDDDPVATIEGTASDLFLRLVSRPGPSLPAVWEEAIDALASPAD